MMTCVAFTKLLLVILMAFIICLPEFFTSDPALSMDSLCLPLHSCVGNTQANISQTQQQVRDTGRGLYGGCVNISTCERMANGTSSGIKCFLCQSEMDRPSLQHKASKSGAATRQLLAVSEVQRWLFLCCGNCTASENVTAVATRLNRSCCVLHALAANSTQCNVSLPWTSAWKESWCSGTRLVWLSLVLIVILLVVGSILYEFHGRTTGRMKKPVLLPVSDHKPPGHPVGYLDELYSTANTCRYKESTLSPIHEYEETGKESSSWKNHVDESDSASVFLPEN